MAARKGGLFAVMGGPRPAEEDDDLDDYADDLELADDDSAEPEALGAGPFDAYAETVFDVEADPASRTDALRQAILTVLEERGR
jgi:hypothetical protein